MNGMKDVEARLDRSLRNQITVPKLGKSFDAAVWARIDAVESRATNPGAAHSSALQASRWLGIVNVAGIAAMLVIACYFALRSIGGVEAPALNVGMPLAMPEISEHTVATSVALLGQVLGAVALLFGLSFTSLGRRLRASFS